MQKLPPSFDFIKQELDKEFIKNTKPLPTQLRSFHLLKTLSKQQINVHLH